VLNSFEIYTVLKNLGYTLEPNKYEPSYASEHALGDGRYLYVKRKADRIVNKSPLVLHGGILTHWRCAIRSTLLKAFLALG